MLQLGSGRGRATSGESLLSAPTASATPAATAAAPALTPATKSHWLIVLVVLIVAATSHWFIVVLVIIFILLVWTLVCSRWFFRLLVVLAIPILLFRLLLLPSLFQIVIGFMMRRIMVGLFLGLCLLQELLLFLGLVLKTLVLFLEIGLTLMLPFS